MSVYTKFNGVNPFAIDILNALEIFLYDIERFRDCGVCFENGEYIIWIFARTG